MPATSLSLDLPSLTAAYGSGIRPSEVVAAVYDRLAARGEDGVWISLLPLERALAAAAALDGVAPSSLPLYGVPFAVKDNIDVAGTPTTAACAAFAYMPEADAPVVARLRAAGAIPIGKTNLDQFATGLVGVRSPYGVPTNPFDPAYVPGGSSSGSAVAVAEGLVGFALGTDTAGSGRVPAGINNIVGLKPSLGLLPTRGVVPACRTLDCVSVFAATVPDAWRVLRVAAGYDEADAYSRPLALGRPGEAAPGFRFGVPRRDQLEFCGDVDMAEAFASAVAGLQAAGGVAVEIDLAPFRETAALLYEGPWVAERLAAIEAFAGGRPEALLPVTREIIMGAAGRTAVEAFKAAYRLADLKRRTAPVWAGIDLMAVPTAPTHYRLADVAADPIRLNANLGIYTNFVNLLDLCALAVPAAMRADGLPAGVTLIAPAGRDARLAAVGHAFHRATGLPLGATGRPQPPDGFEKAGFEAEEGAGEGIDVAVLGAHLSGQPLNGSLQALGAVFRRTVRTTADYRLYRLPGGGVARPGLLRVPAGTGGAVEAEVWRLPDAGFGRFVASIPAPLGIGRVALEGGGEVAGFLAEAEGVRGAEDITASGGWRAWLKASGEA